jgi:lipopolysaccharide assembly LapA-like protein
VRRFLTWVIGLPTAILLVGFAVANRTWVDVSLDPFDRSNPSVYLHMPLWSVLVLGIFLGLVAGWIGAWVNQGRWRRHARALRHDNERLRVENERLQVEIDDHTRPLQHDTGLIGTV